MLTGNRINTRSVFKRKTAEEILEGTLEKIRRAPFEPKPKLVGYAQIGGETLKKVIYE
jgi:hypothetical protein